MLDDLLGRTELKERIEELEAEKDSLQNQLDAEGERRSEAVRDRQEAEERVNELETRVEELEDRVERANDEDDGTGTDLDFRGRENLTDDRRDRTLDLLASLDGGQESVLSAYVSDDLPDAVREEFGARAPLVDRAAPCVVVRDREGVVSAALRPPNPPADAFCGWGDSARIEREWFAPTGRYALAVVRADVFALGVYQAGAEGDVERVHYEGFESDVKGDHSKGGFSQGRFERRRDSQIAEHLDKCQEVLAEVDADRVFVVGQETLLGEFDADATAAVDATGKPEAVLGHAHDDFWTVPLFLV
ncbi:Vms1/Ankzf1 family peptidyl-tRNA hydrolase [Halobacterium zhouii]|uniref:Vms1/Ankzf1 family peptidyl-tRNA hydrolase n=1 Tax=Halobacterium zhouii TaxID=2902624 RepID=UPI001E52A7FA|nr:Vms1/Ankzf1 family peptidyl-tRNA hydrolase [Halobacterium zhouii]